MEVLVRNLLVSKGGLFVLKNIELKQDLIENGKVNLYRAVRRANTKNGNFNILKLAMENEDIRRILFEGMTPEEIIECERIRKNCYQQYKKIYDHLRFLFDGNWDLFFLTLTFSPECLDQTKEKTRRQTITRVLSGLCVDYILNIDYGNENDREHFHAVVAIFHSIGKGLRRSEKKGCYKLPYLDEKYKYGHYDLIRCQITDDDKKKIAWYINKLTLHSLKVRQSYVSVKKGSPYQEYLKLVKEQKRQARQEGRLFKMNFDEKETELLSGFSTV